MSKLGPVSLTCDSDNLYMLTCDDKNPFKFTPTLPGMSTGEYRQAIEKRVVHDVCRVSEQTNGFVSPGCKGSNIGFFHFSEQSCQHSDWSRSQALFGKHCSILDDPEFSLYPTVATVGAASCAGPFVFQYCAPVDDNGRGYNLRDTEVTYYNTLAHKTTPVNLRLYERCSLSDPVYREKKMIQIFGLPYSTWTCNEVKDPFKNPNIPQTPKPVETTAKPTKMPTKLPKPQPPIAHETSTSTSTSTTSTTTSTSIIQASITTTKSSLSPNSTTTTLPVGFQQDPGSSSGISSSFWFLVLMPMTVIGLALLGVAANISKRKGDEKDIPFLLVDDVEVDDLCPSENGDSTISVPIMEKEVENSNTIKKTGFLLRKGAQPNSLLEPPNKSPNLRPNWVANNGGGSPEPIRKGRKNQPPSPSQKRSKSTKPPSRRSKSANNNKRSQSGGKEKRSKSEDRGRIRKQSKNRSRKHSKTSSTKSMKSIKSSIHTAWTPAEPKSPIKPSLNRRSPARGRSKSRGRRGGNHS